MLRRTLLYYMLVTLLLLFKTAIADQNLLEMPKGTMVVSLFEHSELLEDPSRKLTIQQVSSGAYRFRSIKNGTLTTEDIHQGLTRSAFWLRVNMVNPSSETRWFVNSWGGGYRSVNMYIRSGNEQAFKELAIAENHRGVVYEFPSETGTKHTLYIRVIDNQSPLFLTFGLSNINGLFEYTKVTYPAYAAMFSCLLILALYNLFYYFYLRDAGFLSLAVFITAFSLQIGVYMGVWGYFAFIRDNLGAYGLSFGFIAAASLIHVINNLLEVKLNDPKGYRFLRRVSYVCIALALFAPFIYYVVVMQGIISLFLAVVAAIIVVRLHRKNYKFSHSIILSALTFFLSMLPALLMAAGIIDIYGPLINVTPFALLISLVFLSLVQADKVRAQSERAERTLATNQAKDEFLTTMSHELRTPMHAVVSAGRLLKIAKLPKEHSEVVSRLNHSSSHMLSLVNDILDLASTENKMMKLEKHPFHLKEVLEPLDKLLCDAARNKNIALSITNNFVPLNQALVGDRTRLKQVLLNLLSNAIKFTDTGYVSLKITPNSVSQTSVDLLFEVSDSGIGIPPDKLDSLFQPFTQVESANSRQYNGSGLGLAISQKLIQGMGGEIHVESKLNMGSRFFFNLHIPLQPASECPKKETSSTDIDTEKKLNPIRVLLVDDDEMNRFFGEKLLKVCGAEGTVVESGERAIEHLRHEHFDLMLLDVSMPGMDGYQTTKLIRADKTLPDISIVALTAHAIEGERERCLAAGMNDFMSKPFDLADLRDLLHKYSQQSSDFIAHP